MPRLTSVIAAARTVNAESVVALVALCVTLPISIIAVVLSRAANRAATRSARASERSAEASEEQTRIQLALQRHAVEPSIWVDIRGDDQTGQLLRLFVGNSGPTVATNVVITFTPPLRDTPLPIEPAHRGEERLNTGLASVPPGRVLSWPFGSAPQVFADAGGTAQAYEVRIAADGPFGALEPRTYTIDLNDIAMASATPPGTLNGVAKELREISKVIKAGR